MRTLNSSGLEVNIETAVPATSGVPWGSPMWTGSSIGDPTVAPQLEGAPTQTFGVGTYSLDNKLLGTQGTIQVSYVTGASGIQRTLVCLTESPTNPTKRIVVGLDGLNRPYANIYNSVGTLVGAVSPTFGSVPANSSGLVLLSWNSAQAIDGTRFALFQVNRVAVASTDWMTNPTTSWTSFQPTHVVLGFGVGEDLDFNGQLQSVQVSNDTVQGSSAGQFPSNRVFDRFLSDSVVGSTT